MPQVSVVIPVYNGAKFISACVEQVLAQKDFEDFEVIIVNNGSTDNTLEVCLDLSAKSNKVKVFSLDSAGVSKARNKGIDESRGKYILFVDADDLITHNCLSVTYGYAEMYNADVVAFNINHVYKGRGTGHILGNPNDGKVTWCDNIRLARFNLDVVGVYTCNNTTKLYRREFIKIYGIRFDESMSLGEDLYFNLSCCDFAESFVYINRSLYNYIVHSGDTLNRKHRSDMLEIKMGMRERMHAYFNRYGLWDRRWLRKYQASFLNDIFHCIFNQYKSPGKPSYTDSKARLDEIVNHPYVRDCCSYDLSHELSLSKRIVFFFLKYKLKRLLWLTCNIYYNTISHLKSF